jgi:hypothetical protein
MNEAFLVTFILWACKKASSKNPSFHCWKVGLPLLKMKSFVILFVILSLFLMKWCTVLHTREKNLPHICYFCISQTGMNPYYYNNCGRECFFGRLQVFQLLPGFHQICYHVCQSILIRGYTCTATSWIHAHKIKVMHGILDTAIITIYRLSEIENLKCQLLYARLTGSISPQPIDRWITKTCVVQAIKHSLFILPVTGSQN